MREHMERLINCASLAVTGALVGAAFILVGAGLAPLLGVLCFALAALAGYRMLHHAEHVRATLRGEREEAGWLPGDE